MKAGFIGLGAMGVAMAGNLHRAGFLHALWNRSPAIAEGLSADFGVTHSPSPAELAGQVDAILICVSADCDVLEVVRQILPSLKPGQTVIDLSTVSRETAIEAARLIEACGADFIDAPVTGGVEGARNATLSIMVGGAEATLSKVHPILSAMGRKIIHMGKTGSGQSAKAVNQILCAGINEAVTEALAFGQRLNLDMDKLIEILAGGAAGNWFLEKRGPTMIRDTFQPGFKVALHHKDLNICTGMAQTLGIQLPVTAMTLEHYAALMREGHRDEDISALYRLKRPEP